MPILPALIIIEIISVFLVSSISPPSISKLKHNIVKFSPQVFAQDATPSAGTSTPSPDTSSSLDSQPSATPTDTSTTTPSDATQSAPAPDNSQQTQPSDTSLPNPTENPVQSPSDNSATNQPQETPNEINNPQSNNATGSSLESPASSSSIPETESQNQPVVLDESQQQAQAASETVITGGDIISGPVENIDKNVEQTSASQDQKLEQAKTPEEKASLSVDFATQSVKAAEQSLKNDDLQTTTFVAQRISDQIDTAVSNAQISSSSKPLQQVSSFCKQADFIFRTQQLSVPEEETQDFEIIRGKCLNITQ